MILNSTDLKKIANESRSVRGKKLFCKYSDDDPGAALEFKSLNKVKISAINTKEERIVVFNGKYKALSSEIVVNYELDGSDEELVINRKNLSIKYSPSSSCEVMSKTQNVQKKLNSILNLIVINKSQGNKF